MKKSKTVSYEVVQTQVPVVWLEKKWDWSMNDSQIARILGVSRQAVWSTRKAAKAPKSPAKGVQNGTYKERILSFGERIASMTTSAIAAELGCSRGRVAYVLKENGLQPAIAPRVSKIAWPEIGDEAWKLTNEELAERLGTTPGYVYLYRWRKGIPSVKRTRVLERV